LQTQIKEKDQTIYRLREENAKLVSDLDKAISRAKDVED
jgi:hypothetical protein